MSSEYDDSNKTSSEKVAWVIIGASAGGLDALKDFLSNIVAEKQAVYLIAQHLDPKHPTILCDLLSRVTHLPVRLVTEELKPVPNSIYIISPGHNAVIENERICLLPAAEVGPKPSVNLLLHSASEALAERAVAIILSGTGSDGAQGVAAIKAAGGMVIAQSEMSAKYSGMPNAAIETGFVDFILEPAQMPQEIAAYIESAGQTLLKVSQSKAKSSLQKIFQRVLDQTGYDFSGYKLKTIQRRIARRMAVHKLLTLDDYLTLLAGSGTEVESLFKDLLISVTDFFRDTEAFHELRSVIEKKVQDYKVGDQIRVWVPGCAGGEEAYSISILFHEAKLKFGKNFNYQIFATDIDETRLSFARKGQFSLAQIRNLSKEQTQHYFIEREGQFFVQKFIREPVVFARQNLVMDPPFSKLDLISCRNLLIYFSNDLQRQVLSSFHFSLKPKGVLFLDKSESATSLAPEYFDLLMPKAQIFVKKNTHVSKPSHSIKPMKLAKTTFSHRPVMFADKPNYLAQIESILLKEMLPAVVVVDDSGQVLHIRGDVTSYLVFPQGRIDTNILTLVRDDLKIDIRALLQKGKRNGQASSQSLFFQSGQVNNALFINVKRIEIGEAVVEPLFLISFIEVDLTDAFIGEGSSTDEFVRTNDSLSKEVTIFKERLQTSIEELETTNEELQSTNEELQSANEELQSANEELQTANEELQSTNEELSTVNQELEVKSYELEQVNNDLHSMLENINEVVVLIDNRLRLQRYTKIAGYTLGLGINDIGQALTTINLKIEIPNLRQELLNVIEKDTEVCVKVRKGAIVYLIRLVAYKSADDKVTGVMMFFEQESHNAKTDPTIDPHSAIRYLSEHLPFVVIAIDELGVVTFVSEQVKSLLEYDPADILHHNVSMLMPNPYASHHDSYLRQYLSGRTNGLIGSWREVSGLTKSGKRVLLQLRVEEVWINGQKHFLGYLKKVGATDES